MQVTKAEITEGLQLLSSLIETPSFSGNEIATADIIQSYLQRKGIAPMRAKHNLIARSTDWQEHVPTILLCSHHDTVQPNKAYTLDPFQARIEGGKLFGLGSNDAGGSLVAMITAFVRLQQQSLPFNLILAIVAEEEISGKNGIELILPELPDIHLGIIGEPTELRVAVAERGLLVIDAIAQGKPGHAAHGHTINPIEIAADDIVALRALDFDRTSKWLGNSKVTISQIGAGTQHNVVPAICEYVIDVRVNDQYTLDETFAQINAITKSGLTARSMRLHPSHIDLNHPFVKYLAENRVEFFGSPTLSDQALMDFPTIKVGCGASGRSHMADEFIYIDEFGSGIEWYCNHLANYHPILSDS